MEAENLWDDVDDDLIDVMFELFPPRVRFVMPDSSSVLAATLQGRSVEAALAHATRYCFEPPQMRRAERNLVRVQV